MTSSFCHFPPLSVSGCLGSSMGGFMMQRVNIKNKLEEEEKEKLLKLQQE